MNSPATSVARPVALRTVPLVGGARLPLAFIGLGLAALALGVAATAANPALLLLPYMHPQVAGLVHLWLPGFLLSVCIGSIYQLMPVVLGTPLQLALRLAWTHLALHAAGVALLVGGFMYGHFAYVGLGGAVLGAGLALLATAIFRTFRSSRRRDAAAWSFPIAGSWLAATVVLGVVLAINRRWPFLPLSALDLLRTHAHLGLVGFFLTLLQGVTFQLVPMFTMGTLRWPRCIWGGLLGSQVGLLVLIPGLAGHSPGITAPGALLLILAIACSGVALAATVRTRRRRKLDPGLRAFLVGAITLGAAALLGGALTVSRTLPLEPGRAVATYGILIIGGGLPLVVLGMLCKIIPFLVWMRVYGPRVGKQAVPVATSLASRPLELCWLPLHVAAVAVIAAGVATASTRATTIGTWLLATAVAVLLTNFGRVAGHLWKPHGRSGRPAQPDPLAHARSYSTHG